MVKVMAVNAGSSSLKFQLINMPSEEVITLGLVERIGQEVGNFVIKVNGEKIQTQTPIPDHQVAVDLLLNALVDHHIVESLEEIDAVGHRVVHGGEDFDDSVVVDEEAVKKVADLAELAPLHNPANIIGYKAFKEALPNHVGHVFVFDTAFHQTLDKERYLYPLQLAPLHNPANIIGYNAFKKALPHAGHVFVFDTAFHQTLDKERYLYPLPLEYYTDLKVRKYGAHGTSHKYVSQQAIEMLGNPKESRIIVCHLGNGASVSAVQDGKCIDTSMGFTPLAGVMMGTRSGDVDPSVMPYLCKKLNKTADEVLEIYNKKSGMLGISGISSDSRDIENALFNEGNERALLTGLLYARIVSKYIGQYYAELGGCDAICFTAGVGENAAYLRRLIIDNVSRAFGVFLDEELNSIRSDENRVISHQYSQIKVMVIPTNEEVMIARDTVRLLDL